MQLTLSNPAGLLSLQDARSQSVNFPDRQMLAGQAKTSQNILTVERHPLQHDMTQLLPAKAPFAAGYNGDKARLFIQLIFAVWRLYSVSVVYYYILRSVRLLSPIFLVTATVDHAWVATTVQHVVLHLACSKYTPVFCMRLLC